MDPSSQLTTGALHTVTLHIYIYRRQMDPLVNQAQGHCIPFPFIHVHIYIEKADGPLSQSSTEAFHTVTLHIYI